MADAIEGVDAEITESVRAVGATGSQAVRYAILPEALPALIAATIFRFGNVVGPRGTHGAALDFLRKLERTPEELEVLGDGRQAKPYVHVSDCVEAILFALDHAESLRVETIHVLRQNLELGQ